MSNEITSIISLDELILSFKKLMESSQNEREKAVCVEILEQLAEVENGETFSYKTLLKAYETLSHDSEIWKSFTFFIKENKSNFEIKWKFFEKKLGVYVEPPIVLESEVIEEAESVLSSNIDPNVRDSAKLVVRILKRLKRDPDYVFYENVKWPRLHLDEYWYDCPKFRLYCAQNPDKFQSINGTETPKIYRRNPSLKVYIMKKILSHPLSLLTLFLVLASCSKAPLEIEQENLSPQQLAQRYATRLQSPDAGIRQMAREEMATFDSNKMDWAYFWQLAIAAPKGAVDLGSADLQRFAPIDCSKRAHGEFIGFVLKEEKGMAHFLREKVCPLPEEGQTVEKMLLLANRQGFNPEENTRFFLRLRSERPSMDVSFVQNLGSEKWNSIHSYLQENPQKLRDLLATLAPGIGGRLPFSEYVLNTTFKKLYENGSSMNGTELYSSTYLIAMSAGVEAPPYNQAQADALLLAFANAWREKVSAISSDSNCNRDCIAQAVETASLFPRVIHTVSERVELRLQLEANEKIERQIEEQLGADKIDFTLSALSDSNNRLSRWLKIRLSQDLRLQSEKRAQVNFEMPALEMGPAERAVHLRVAIHSSRDFEERQNLVQRLCDLFEESSYSIADIKAQDLSDPDKMAPGCYKLIANQAIDIKSLSLPFDSVIRSYGEHVEMNIDHLDASIFDFTAYHDPAEARPEKAPNDADAIVLPFLLGLRLDGPHKDAPDEIHLFTVHTQVRQAQSLLVATKFPNDGSPGGDLQLVTGKSSFLPSFTSLGGPGQKSHPRREGGKGDESFMSLSRQARAKFLEFSGPNQEGINFIDNLSPKMLRSLWVQAEEKGGLPKLIFSTQINLACVPAKQKKKIEDFCRHMGYSVEQMEACFEEEIYPIAEKHVRDLVDGFQLMSQEERESADPRLDARKIYSVPGGQLGPENPHGRKGSRGQLWITL